MLKQARKRTSILPLTTEVQNGPNRTESITFLSKEGPANYYTHKTDAFDSTKQRNLYKQGRYGDVVFFIFGHMGLWIHLFGTYSILTSDKDVSIKRNAVIFMATWLLTNFLFFLAVFKDSLWYSRLAMLSVSLLVANANTMQFPSPGECNIAQEYQLIVMAIMANVSLSFYEKMSRLGFLFVLGSYVSMNSPFSIYVKDTLPILGGTILLAVFALYVYHFSIAREYATVQAARLVLAAIFSYHTILQMPEIGSSAAEQLPHLIKSFFLASIGAIATGIFHREVIQKEQLEIVVRKRTQKLHMVNMALQASETAIVITDESGCIIWINKAFESFCGETETSLVGMPVNDVIYNLDPSRKENKFALIESHEDLSMAREAELQIRDSIYAHESTPFLEHQGIKQIETENNRFLMVFRDVTATRAREVAEQKAQDKAMMAKAMGDSMVTLTHELRTPLQGIMGIASLLMQGNELSSDAIDSMRLIMASSTLLLNLINNLLDVKKATAKMLEEFPITLVSATSPIEDSIIFSKPLASISDVEVFSDVALAPNAVVWSNSLRLQQVLINLVSNAIKYTAKGSKIVVRTYESTVQDVHSMIDGALASSRDSNISTEEELTKDQAMLVFSVSDCGPGIEPDQADRLFQRYVQLDNQSCRSSGSGKIGQPSGTGLGLHLCQMFVQRMNGYIWATNNGVKGSTFSFSLPLQSNEFPKSSDESDMITVRGSRRLSGVRRLSMSGARRLSDTSCISLHTSDDLALINDDVGLVYSKRVLLVDDILINRKVLSRILVRVGFLNVTTVESGEAALEELSTNKKYDLVISDLQMPGMSGTELSEAIAAKSSCDDSFSRPVVIGLTADTSLDVAERCRESKMSDVLYKPITIEEVGKYAETVVLSLQPGVWFDGNIEEEGCIFGTEMALPVQ